MGYIALVGCGDETPRLDQGGDRIAVFAEISAEISGRKNCKVAIICSSRLRFAALLTQKSLSSGRQSCPCGLKSGGAAAPPGLPGGDWRSVLCFYLECGRALKAHGLSIAGGLRLKEALAGAAQPPRQYCWCFGLCGALCFLQFYYTVQLFRYI